MTHIPPPVIGRQMGRKPLKPKDPTVKTTLRVPRSLFDRIEALAGPNRNAIFIRDAVEAEVIRQERALKEGAIDG